MDSLKFLGLRYYPGLRRAAFAQEFFKMLILSLLLDLCIGYPVTTGVLIILELCIFSGANFDRFVAETRNGASLEFTSRESFLSYLAVSRELLLHSPYEMRRWESQPLTK